MNVVVFSLEMSFIFKLPDHTCALLNLSPALGREVPTSTLLSSKSPNSPSLCIDPRKHKGRKVKEGNIFKHFELLFEDEEREFYL